MVNKKSIDSAREVRLRLVQIIAPAIGGFLILKPEFRSKIRSTLNI